MHIVAQSDCLPGQGKWINPSCPACLFVPRCAGEKRALGPEAGGLVGWLMGLKLR